MILAKTAMNENKTPIAPTPIAYLVLEQAVEAPSPAQTSLRMFTLVAIRTTLAVKSIIH